MDGRQEFLAYLATATLTVVGLFTLQLWYESYLDVSVVHARYAQAGRNAQVSAKRAGEQKRLDGGKLSIDAAMKQLADRGRSASTAIAPVPSQDLSAMAGWVHRPGFEPYVPKQPLPAQAPATEGVTAEDGAPPEGAPSPTPAEGTTDLEGAAPAAEPTQE